MKTRVTADLTVRRNAILLVLATETLIFHAARPPRNRFPPKSTVPHGPMKKLPPLAPNTSPVAGEYFVAGELSNHGSPVQRQ
jgi:hypothetical protein